jgi:hypothetical protein
MCQQCAIREMQAHENLEAADLLKMLIDKMHATVGGDGGAVTYEIDLDEADADWLAAWGAENEDKEIDDPTEEDMPPEASENLESDCRERSGPGETAAVFHKADGSSGIAPYKPA